MCSFFAETAVFALEAKLFDFLTRRLSFVVNEVCNTDSRGNACSESWTNIVTHMYSHDMFHAVYLNDRLSVATPFSISSTNRSSRIVPMVKPKLPFHFVCTGRACGDVVDGGEGGLGALSIDGRRGVSAACRERHELSRAGERRGGGSVERGNKGGGGRHLFALVFRQPARLGDLVVQQLRRNLWLFRGIQNVFCV